MVRNASYAKFRSKLMHAAIVNMSVCAVWDLVNEQHLQAQFRKSGALDERAFRAHMFERDVGLVLADGKHSHQDEQVRS